MGHSIYIVLNVYVKTLTLNSMNQLKGETKMCTIKHCLTHINYF